MWPREETEAGAMPHQAGKPQGGSPMTGEIVNPEGAGRPRPAGSKFTYASGSRPLDGYTIKRGVGIGGFGEVYFATSDAGKEVALKRIQRNLDIELRGVRQCLNLKHQNLVALYDIKYDEQEQAWVVMEYVPGSSLKDIIEQNPQGMPIEDVQRWFRGLASGTAYLHDHGIVHRDLKPGNIFEDDGCVKIGDYGLSKFISCSRRSGQTESVGTFHYMAPEIGKGNYGREIDIYALGIILYEMLTGNVPFDGESTQEIIMKHLTADPDVSRMAQPYRYVIQRALLKDPQKRFHAVYEMVDALGLASPSEISAVGRGSARPLAEREIETPPIAIVAPMHEPLFISDDAEMVFGPVKHSHIAEDSLPSAALAGPSASTQSPPHSNFVDVARAPIQTAAPHQSESPPVLAAAGAALASGVATAASSSDQFWRALDLRNEPIARIAMQMLAAISDWWSSPALGTGVRIVVIIAVVIGLTSASILYPALLLVFLGYAIYLGIRYSVNNGNLSEASSPIARTTESPHVPAHGKGLFTPSNGAATVENTSIPPVVASPPRAHSAHRETARAPLQKSMVNSFAPDYLRRERRMMFWSSLFFSALLAVGLSLGVVLLIQERTVIRVGDSAQVALVCWVSAVSVACVWSIQLISRLFNATKDTSILHRIVMSGVGAGVACFAIALQQFLQIAELPTDGRFINLNVTSPVQLFGPNWPSNFSLVAFFTAIFAAIRWWKHGDPMRTSRWNFSAIAGAMMVAWLIGVVLRIPQPWPIAIAGILALSLQLGSVRYSAKRRTELRQPFAISA